MKRWAEIAKEETEAGMREIEEKIVRICKDNDLTVVPNIRDNVMRIIESAEPSKQEKLKAFDLFEQWLCETHKY